MNKTEVGKLLTIISGFDRRQVDVLTVEAWHAIPEVAAADFGIAQQIVVKHHGEPGTGYFDARTLVAELRRVTRLTPADIETDVRVAKQRGLLDPDWPARQALPADVAQRLADARERDRLESARYEIEATP